MKVGEVIKMLHMGQPFDVEQPFYALVTERFEDRNDQNKLVVMTGGYVSGSGIGKHAGEHFFLPDVSGTGIEWEVVQPSDKLLVMMAEFALTGRVSNG